MPEKTTRYQLHKPQANEYVEIGVLNENFDIIDETMGKFADELQNGMRAEVYDPQGKATDIFLAIDDAKYLTDDVTGKRYRLGVQNGALYYAQQEEAQT